MAVGGHTSIELRQAAASTNLMASVIGDWAKGHGFDEGCQLAQWMENQAATLKDTDAGETVHSFGGQDYAFHELLTLCVEVFRNNIVAGYLMLIVSEASEALDSLRDTGFTDIKTHGNFGEELADVEIRVKHLANLLGFDLGQIEVDKIKKNATRPHKHGRKM